MDDCDFLDFWDSTSNEITLCEQQQQQLLSTWTPKGGSKKVIQQQPVPNDIVIAFNQHLRAWLAENYLRQVQGQAGPIEEQLDSINEAIMTNTSPSLSDVMVQLNNCNNDIRTLQLDLKTGFGLKIAKQAGRFLESLDRQERAGDLLALSYDDHPSRPARLRERIAELRGHLAEIAAARHQEREERRQQKDEERQRRKEELRMLREEQETVRDGRTMRGVAWMTMAFLPATFVSSFFGMNFFAPVPGKSVFDDSSRNVWVFFAVALPTSIVILSAFYWWDKGTEREAEAQRQKVEDVPIF
ncbi:hypothetical protein IQ06DRAFT_229553 [Phaeosphaeriaceae sp. SRC1lsM3a]|nr:hypothetical protein IQ06DRAFT_229553 [Stagonospora sp. SRC1lsM3a]